MADFINTGKEFVNGFEFSSIMWMFIWIGVMAVFVILFVAIYFMYSNNKKYNKRVRIFRRVGGKMEEIFQDKAKSLKIGKTGDEFLYLKKLKRPCPLPTKQAGRNLYYMHLREDGELVDIGLEDMDEKNRELKFNYLHREMRYARLALHKNLEQNFKKANFFEKYGILILGILYIFIIGMIVWFLVDKINDGMSALLQGIKLNGEMLEANKEMVNRLSTLCNIDGLKPAP